MPLPAIVGELVAPVANLIDKLVTTQEERGQIRLALIEAQIGMAQKVMEYEATLAEAKMNVIVAEAKGESWLQRNWRPLTMMVFTSIVAWNYIVVDLVTWAFAAFGHGGDAPPRLAIPEGMWTLLNIGIGGYIVGRSAEKVTESLANRGISFGKKEDDPAK